MPDSGNLAVLVLINLSAASDKGCVVYRHKKNIAVLKVTVLYTMDFLNTVVYCLAVLMFNNLSSWHNLFHFVYCVL